MAGNQESSQLFDIADEVRDCIFLKKLHLTAIIGNDAWGRCHKTQPVVLSIRLQHLLSAAGKSDDIDDTVSYGKISKDILEYVGENHAKDFSNAANFTSEIMILATTMKWGGDRLEIMTALPKGSLQAQCGIGYSAVYDWPTTAIPQSSDGLLLRILKKNRYFIRDLRIMSFIGVNEHEKEVQQAVVLNISIAETRDVVEVVEKTCDVPTVSLIQWISLVSRNNSVLFIQNRETKCLIE